MKQQRPGCVEHLMLLVFFVMAAAFLGLAGAGLRPHRPGPVVQGRLQEFTTSSPGRNRSVYIRLEGVPAVFRVESDLVKRYRVLDTLPGEERGAALSLLVDPGQPAGGAGFALVRELAGRRLYFSYSGYLAVRKRQQVVNSLLASLMTAVVLAGLWYGLVPLRLSPRSRKLRVALTAVVLAVPLAMLAAHLAAPGLPADPLAHLELELARHPRGFVCLEHLVEEAHGRGGVRDPGRYLDLAPTPEAGYRLAGVFFGDGSGGGERERLLLAARLYEQALRDWPEEEDQVEPHWMIGRALWQAGNRLEAEPWLRRAWELSARHPDRIPVWMPEEDLEGIRALLDL